MTTIHKENIPIAAITLIQKLQDVQKEAYLVGGCVRDLLLNETPHDFDICTNATPTDVIEMLKSHNIPYHTVGIAYGTITAILQDEEYEITTYRSEKGYTDNRHPNEVYFETDIMNDLKRRDFTINAMAYNPLTEELIDAFGGQKDIENGIIRCVGNPTERFNEDPLRILRAIRFANRYGFKLDNETYQSIYTQRDQLNNISKERITDEFRKILTNGKEVKDTFYNYFPIITTIIPALNACVGFEQNNKYHTHDVYMHSLYVVDNCKTDDFVIKMAALLHDVGKPESYFEDEDKQGHFYGHPEVSAKISKYVLQNDLRLTKEETDEILTLIKYHDKPILATTKSVKRVLNRLGQSTFYKWLVLQEADRSDHINLDIEKGATDLTKVKEIADKIITEQDCFKINNLAINGNDLQNELGIPQGKEIGFILVHLLDDVIDEIIPNIYQSLAESAIAYDREYNEVKEYFER